MILFLFSIVIFLLAPQNQLNELREKVNHPDFKKTFQENPQNIESIVRLSYAYLGINPDSSIHYGTIGLKYALQYEYIVGQIEALRTIGFAYTTLGYYEDAFKNFSEAEQIAIANKHKTGLARVYNNFAIAYKNLGRYDDAMRFNFKSIEIKKELSDSLGLANSYGNIAILYKNLEDFTNASNYFSLALLIFEKLNLAEKMATTFANIAAIKMEDAKPDSALILYDKALIVLSDSPMSHNKAQIYTDKARILIQTGNIDEAKVLFEKSLTHFLDSKDLYGASTTYYGLSELYLVQNKLKDAIYYGENALTYAKRSNNLKQISLSYKKLANLYAKSAEYQKAFDYHTQFHFLNDSLEISQNAKKIAQLSADYSLRQREKELELLFSKQQTNKQIIIAITSVLLIATTLILITIILSKRKLRKAYATISAVNKEIANLNKNLNIRVQERTEKLENLNNQLKQFTFSTNHQLRRPLANILGLIEVLTHTNPSETQYEEVLAHLKSASVELDTVIKNMNTDLHRYEINQQQ